MMKPRTFWKDAPVRLARSSPVSTISAPSNIHPTRLVSIRLHFVSLASRKLLPLSRPSKRITFSRLARFRSVVRSVRGAFEFGIVLPNHLLAVVALD